MLSRSAGSPLVLGLGTAAILAAGTAPVLAADDAPAPELTVKVIASETTAEAGEFITLSVTVKAADEEAKDLKDVTVSSITRTPENNTILEDKCRPPDCTIKVGEEKPTTVATVTAKKSITKNTKVDVVVQVDYPDAGQEADAKGTQTLTFTRLTPSKPSPSPTPTTSPTLSPGKGKGPSDGKEGKEKDDDDNDSDNDSSGSGSSSGGSNGSGSSGSSYTPPSPNASFTPPATPGVSLPSIAPPNPSVAPGQLTPTPESRLRNNKAPVAQDLTFEQMASTQVAWLAALLAAFSLLLTQLRLGRRRAAPGTAAAVKGSAAPKRSKGAHRRPRRGVFGK
ncbi:hypothetical protein ABZ801_27695 [Actinomadura sp. NPDC047616]|uniref:hypothetical protein n=1 Tax=Actinomadura sp. NPDC047616 TaxID=3155914 RepID=UPI0033CD145C